jgi:hypothetical protein
VYDAARFYEEFFPWLRTPTNVILEQPVDQRLVAHAFSGSLHAKRPEHIWVDADRDELARRATVGRPADPPGPLQLLVGQLRNLREINLLVSRTPPSLCGSPAAR